MVDRPSMLHRWEELTFLHWSFEPSAVQRLLPAGLEVDTFDGRAWVGLVPFQLRVTVPGVPYLPWIGRFPETNVRAYARTADGVPAVWFLSLDASRLAAAVYGRAYGLPYAWAQMRLQRVGGVVRYASRRRWPGAGPGLRATVLVGPRYRLDDLTELDRFLTHRWALFTRRNRGLAVAPASHDPWPLHRARVFHLREDMLAAAGLPSPEGPPLVHFSPGVAVRLGRVGPLEVQGSGPWEPSSSTATT
jgi:uncharacterized protein YqjF (DUF2071 family)